MSLGVILISHFFLIVLITAGQHLASVGYPHDGYICLWDFQSQTLITKCKGFTPSSAVESVSFSSDGRLFITAGKRHLKFWKLGLPTRSHRKARTASGAVGKQANLGHHKGCSFIAVASSTWGESSLLDHIRTGEASHVYALTDAGYKFNIHMLSLCFCMFLCSLISSFVNRGFVPSKLGDDYCNFCGITGICCCFFHISTDYIEEH